MSLSGPVLSYGMRILFATAHPHLPQFSGGSQSSIHELALELMRHGHEVAVLAALWGSGYVGWRSRIFMKLLRSHIARDRLPGYDVYRKWFVWEDVESVAAEACPDIAVVMAMKPVPVAHALLQAEVPTVVYLRDAEFQSLGGDPRVLEGVTYIANSRFTAQRYRDAFGINAFVVPPLFHAERYRVQRTGRGFVTFINPSPVKGRDLAFDIAAACRDIPFQFVEAWPLKGAERDDLRHRLAQAPNVTFKRRTDDMRRVYAETRLLLAPSRWEEAWGRVATEAHFSGIPVVASNRGGLPESVGPGGILLDLADPLDVWSAAVRRLWEDEAFYEEKSRAALAYSQRPELDPTGQVARLLDIFQSTGKADSDLSLSRN